MKRKDQFHSHFHQKGDVKIGVTNSIELEE